MWILIETKVQLAYYGDYLQQNWVTSDGLTSRPSNRKFTCISSYELNNLSLGWACMLLKRFWCDVVLYISKKDINPVPRSNLRTVTIEYRDTELLKSNVMLENSKMFNYETCL